VLKRHIFEMSEQYN
jgi:hypothetical protein